jgi:hypothetical protein
MTPDIKRLFAVSKADLDRRTAAELLAPAKITSRDDAELVRAALYLKLGCLAECHTIAQSVTNATGSYWHGIMHRHEGDIGNSKYWYARVGRHPVLEAIGGYPKDAAAEAREFDLLLRHTIAAATGTSSPTE